MRRGSGIKTLCSSYIKPGADGPVIREVWRARMEDLGAIVETWVLFMREQSKIAGAGGPGEKGGMELARGAEAAFRRLVPI